MPARLKPQLLFLNGDWRSRNQRSHVYTQFTWIRCMEKVNWVAYVLGAWLKVGLLLGLPDHSHIDSKCVGDERKQFTAKSWSCKISRALRCWHIVLHIACGNFIQCFFSEWPCGRFPLKNYAIKKYYYVRNFKVNFHLIIPEIFF